MSGYEIVFYALVAAFCQIEVLHFGSVKPFSCLKCMCGWYGLIIGCIAHGWHGIIFLPLGVFVGAIFSAIQQRWL